MFLIRKFSGDRFERINALIDEHEHMLTRYVNLIASASYPFPEVLGALSLPMSTFPTEGFPGQRYFPGSHVMDGIELEAQTLIRTLFRLPDDYSATIQPHSGTQANQIVFNAVLKDGDTVLSFKPTDGGHVSHTVLVGRRNPVIYYGVTEEGVIDYAELARLAETRRPRLIIAGSSSYPLEIDYAAISSIAAEAGALMHADVSHTALFIAAGVHRAIFPGVDFATFNMSKNLRGPSGGVLIYRNVFHKQVQSSVFPGTQGGPLENVLFAKLTAFQMLAQLDLGTYAQAVRANARTFAETLQSEGIEVVAPPPGMHIVLVDLRPLGITGIDAEKRLESQHILANRNQVPGDRLPPRIASGIRIGTTCITLLDYKSEDVMRLAEAIAALLKGKSPPNPNIIPSLLQRYQASITSAGERQSDASVSPMREHDPEEGDKL